MSAYMEDKKDDVLHNEQGPVDADDLRGKVADEKQTKAVESVSCGQKLQ